MLLPYVSQICNSEKIYNKNLGSVECDPNTKDYIVLEKFSHKLNLKTIITKAFQTSSTGTDTLKHTLINLVNHIK